MEPQSVKTAMADSRWLQAMKEEYTALMKNNTWSLVPLPPHKKAIGCKWLFRVKENPDGTVNKFKARLVAKGFLQIAGFDFTETFSQSSNLSLYTSFLHWQLLTNGRFNKLT
jgi:histone deacetylase 1/2